MSNLITAHNVIDEAGHHDRLYVFGADIADPENDPSAIVDDSTDPGSWAFVIEVASSEDEQPYIAALEAHGLTVTGTDNAGDWVCEQSAPLRTR
ncbi:hypothetical protein MUG78_17915 [Gordonia alkaliphila]|uniref:hypothetical protein n=1 Tax=Gordonia alkaliphila TaxID=1053547 RepID=UPI001FF3E658|nr:hypothetical protein [Gordonia alkaliphila]MCK0441279.1 hypothetical protein [Gordonia alkaliphila]